MRCAVSPNCEKLAVALIVSLAGKVDGMPRASRGYAVDLQFVLAQTGKSRPGKFRGAAATGGGVHDGKESFHLRHDRILSPEKGVLYRLRNLTTGKRPWSGPVSQAAR